ncbi:MAG: histidinol-phosphate transaminase [Oscillospiraceae bacterium]|nr:histidinol-phosphate transaminase [Oscillospiraceae bacterium]
MSRFLAKRFNMLEAYTPGEQPSNKKYIKLNTNESPYPPPETFSDAIVNEFQKVNLYPNPDGNELIKKIAQLYKVKQENVIIGNGSDELLAFAFLAFFEDGVIFPDITYGFYPVYAKLYDIPYTEVPLLDDLTINVNDYLSVNKNIVLANPNAPTGIALKLPEIESIIKSNPGHIVIIDEAYVDFGADSAIPLTKKYENLIVMHTFSKSRSMAGARLAFAVASASVMEDMNKMKYSFNPYNVNRLTQVMGEAAIESEGIFIRNRENIISTRDYTKTRLKKLGFLMTDSMANFLFCKHPDIGGGELYQRLKKSGILVRHWSKQRIMDYVRITIGSEEQMDALIKAVEKILIEVRSNQ